MKIELLIFEGCPHAPPARALLGEVLAALCPDAAVLEVDVATPALAAAQGFWGSPSIRVDGRDLEGLAPPDAPSLSCRVYGDEGVPPRWMIEAAVLRALQPRPRSYLFLCVANSARSQLAEGIARSLAPAGVALASAGSEPASVRPEATEVLQEIGIDSSAQRSTSVSDVDPAGIDAVVTLCAEEICPAFLGQANRVHWGLADPAAVQGEGRLDAFRAARDELRRRLEALFC